MTSFSQSSIAALLLGLAVLAAYRWDLRATLYVAIALVAIALVVLLAAPPSLHFGLKGSGGSAEQRDERSHEPDLRRPGPVRRAPAAGLRVGLV